MIVHSLLNLLMSGVAQAAEEAANSEAGIPKVVAYQLLNFALFFIILYVLLRDKIRIYFAERGTHYHAAVNRAKQAKAEADAARAVIEAKLKDVESSTRDAIQKARQDATELSAKIVTEGEQLAARLKQDAQATAGFEIARAREELRQEFLNQAVVAAKQTLTDKMKDADQKRLQDEFVEKIQVVGS